MKLKLILVAALAVALTLGIAPFDLEAQGLGPNDLWYDASPGNLVVTYHEIHPELADPDPTPNLKVKG